MTQHSFAGFEDLLEKKKKNNIQEEVILIFIQN